MSVLRRIIYVSCIVNIVYITDVLSQNAENCKDNHTSCPSWARNGICRSQAHIMKDLCPVSCEFCESSPRQLPTIVDPEFDCGRPYPKLSTNRRNRVLRQAIRQPQGQNGAIRQGEGDQPKAQTPNVRVEDAICGATVIHPRFVLTAAHCVLDPTRPVSTVRLGELDFSKENEENSQAADYAIERIIVHPDFDPNLVERYNDLALLQTAVPIQFNEVVYPFCLTAIRPPTNAIVTGSGFGKVNETSHSQILQEAELSIVDTADCEASYRRQNLDGLLKQWYPFLLQGRGMMCAGHPGRGACEGDGGGPIFRDDNSGRRHLVGVVSIAMGCQGEEKADLPGVYVSIADHINFIDSVIYGF